MGIIQRTRCVCGLVDYRVAPLAQPGSIEPQRRYQVTGKSPLWKLAGAHTGLLPVSMPQARDHRLLPARHPEHTPDTHPAVTCSSASTVRSATTSRLVTAPSGTFPDAMASLSCHTPRRRTLHINNTLWCSLATEASIKGNPYSTH